MFDFAGIANAFSSAHGGPFHAATINHDGTPTYDSGGSITAPGTPTSEACTVQVDIATLAMRGDTDFQERDVRLLVLGVDALTTTPTITVTAGPFAGTTYALRSVTRDPAALGWECRGRAIAGGA